ncbi:RGS domain-containing protein [Phyllosticta capitalensis]
MHSRRNQPPALRLKTPSSSAPSSPTPSLFDDDQTTSSTTPSKMSASEYVPAKPLTVTIPKGYAQGPYCIRRPNLSEILANTGSPPWTLSAFMAYLSQNHCLETLEFTMDASRYKKHYDKMVGANPEAAVCPESDECNFVRMLWQRLLDAYIAPNGPREVNLPSDVRDSLLEKSHPCIPPHPSTLDTAVRKIYELMEESVLVPFLNSLSPQSAADSSYNTSDENLSHSHTRSYDERALRRDLVAQSSSSQGSQAHRASAPSSLTSSFSNVTRNFGAAAHARFASASHFRHPHSGASSTAASPSDRDGLTDDSTASSPSAMADPMTPPTTPPMSDYGCPTTGSTPSPGNSRESSSWKRMSSRLGWKKRSSGHMRQDHVDHQQMEGGMF